MARPRRRQRKHRPSPVERAEGIVKMLRAKKQAEAAQFAPHVRRLQTAIVKVVADDLKLDGAEARHVIMIAARIALGEFTPEPDDDE